jgi:hypothetical protein
MKIALVRENGIDYVGIDYRYYEDDYFRQLSDAEKNKCFEADTRIVVKRSDFIPELCALDNPTLVIASLEDTYYNVRNLRRYTRRKT